MLLAVLDAGARRLNDLGESFKVMSEATDLVPVRWRPGRRPGHDLAEVQFVPTMQVEVDIDAPEVFRLIHALEDSDDVQNVYADATPRTRSSPALDEE